MAEIQIIASNVEGKIWSKGGLGIWGGGGGGGGGAKGCR